MINKQQHIFLAIAFFAGLFALIWFNSSEQFNKNVFNNSNDQTLLAATNATPINDNTGSYLYAPSNPTTASASTRQRSASSSSSVTSNNSGGGFGWPTTSAKHKISADGK